MGITLTKFQLKAMSISEIIRGDTKYPSPRVIRPPKSPGLIGLRAFMILPSLLLQKPSSRSKAKEHAACLARRLTLWRNDEISALMKECRHIQKKLISSKKQRTTEDIARIFAKLVMEGKLSAALKFLDSANSGGILGLSEKVINDLKSKHPPAEPVADNCLLFGPIEQVKPWFFASIDEQTILSAAAKTKGSAGPSGMDAELYRRILCSKSFNIAGKTLREEIATFTKNLLLRSYDPLLLEPFIACRLIPLDKNPGIRPIGVGEVLRRIVGKVVTHHCNEEIREAAGPLQSCAGHGAGAESAIHAMRLAFENDSTDAVLLIDASNAFNSMNRAVGSTVP